MEIINSIQITKGDFSKYTHVTIARDKYHSLLILHKKNMIPSSKVISNSLVNRSYAEKEGRYLIYTTLPVEVVNSVEAAIHYLKTHNKHLLLSATAFIQGYVLAETKFDLLNNTCFGY